MIEEEVILTQLRDWVYEIEAGDSSVVAKIESQIAATDFPGIIRHEIKKRLRHRADAKEGVYKSLVQRSQRRLERLRAWMSTRAGASYESFGPLLAELCPPGVRPLLLNISSLLQRPRPPEDQPPLGTTAWYLYTGASQPKDSAYFLGLAEVLSTHRKNAGADQLDVRDTFNKLIQDEWVGNDYDASRAIATLIKMGKIELAHAILSIYPNPRDQEILDLEESKSYGDLRASLHGLAAQAETLRKQEASLGIDRDAKAWTDFQDRIDSAERLILSKRLGEASQDITQARLSLDRASVEIARIISERRAALRQTFEKARDRFKEAALDLSDNQIRVLRTILRQLDTLGKGDLSGASNVDTLQQAFESAMAGEVLLAEEMLKGDWSAPDAAGAKSVTEDAPTSQAGTSPLLEEITNYVRSQDLQKALDRLMEHLDSRDQVYDVLWRAMPVLKGAGVPDFDLRKLEEGLASNHLYKELDVSLYEAGLCGERGCAMGLHKDGQNRHLAESAFRDLNIRQYRQELRDRLRAIDPEGALRLFREWTRLFPDNAGLLVDYGYGEKEFGSFEGAWRAWSRAVTLAPSPQRLDILSRQCRESGYPGLAAYYAARAYRRLMSDIQTDMPVADSELAQMRLQLERNALALCGRIMLGFSETRRLTYTARSLLAARDAEFSKILDLLIQCLATEPEYWTAGRTLLEFLTGEEVSGEIISFDEGINIMADFLIPLRPNSGQLHYLLAELYLSRGETKEGERFLIRSGELKFRHAHQKIREMQQSRLDQLQVGALFCRGRFKVLERLQGAEGSSGIGIRPADPGHILRWLP